MKNQSLNLIYPKTAGEERQLDGQYVQVLAIKKLKGASILLAAAKHNHRELAAELGAASHIDSARSILNRVLRGANTAAEVAAYAKSLMHTAGIKKLRKDAVRGIEFIVSLPPASGIDEPAFFDAATQWVEDTFDGTVISAVTHLDEDAPHVHIILLPLVDGHMVGSSLVGQYGSAQEAFYQQVGQRFGLARPVKRKRLGAAIRRQAMDMIITALQANSGLSDAVLHVLLEPHLADPTSLMAVLNIAMPGPLATKGSFVGTMIKRCKPERPAASRTKAIGFDNFNDLEKGQSLCSVGFDEPSTALAAASAPTAVPDDKTIIATAEQPTDTDNVAATVTSVPGGASQTSHDECTDKVTLAVTETPEHDTAAGTDTPCALDTSSASDIASSAAKDADQSDKAGKAWTREREQDLPSNCWYGESGTWVKPPSKPASAKSLADAAVAAALKNRKRGKSPDEDSDQLSAD